MLDIYDSTSYIEPTQTDLLEPILTLESIQECNTDCTWHFTLNEFAVFSRLNAD